jgi:hypothetical protein
MYPEQEAKELFITPLEHWYRDMGTRGTSQDLRVDVWQRE